jgi:hypothetical protein
MSWWDVLKAPLYDRVDRDAALLQYLRDSTGEDQEPTRLRQINMGEEVPVTQPKNVVGTEHGFGFPRLNNPNLKGSPFNPKKYLSELKNTNFTHFFQSPEGNVRAGIKHLGKNHYGIDHLGTRDDMREAGLGREGLKQLRRELEAMHGGEVFMSPINTIVPESRGFWEKMAREGVTNPYGYIFDDRVTPANWKMGDPTPPRPDPIPGPNDSNYVKKEAKTPAAIEHKRKYETKYESTPARKKYRRELERERRKRGVAGKGGGDMSHTKTGKIVVEDPHTNRARSHPSVGSTLKMVIVKAPQMNLYGESAECAICKAGVDSQQAYASNSIFGETVCVACIQKEQDKINQENDMMYHSEPSDRTKQMTLDGQIAPPSPRITMPVEDPSVVRDRIDSNTDALKQRLTPRTNEQFAQDQEGDKARRRKLKLNAMRQGQSTLPHKQ